MRGVDSVPVTTRSHSQENLERLDAGLSFFDDYDPPQIDALSLQRDHRRASDSFGADSLQTAKRLGGQNDVSDSSDEPLAGSANASGTVRFSRWLSHARDLTFFKRLELSNPGIDFEWLAERVQLMRAVLLGCDYTYRAVVTAMRLGAGRARQHH